MNVCARSLTTVIRSPAGNGFGTARNAAVLFTTLRELVQHRRGNIDYFLNKCFDRTLREKVIYCYRLLRNLLRRGVIFCNVPKLEHAKCYRNSTAFDGDTTTRISRPCSRSYSRGRRFATSCSPARVRRSRRTRSCCRPAARTSTPYCRSTKRRIPYS